MAYKDTSDRQKWLLAMIGTVKQVEGRIRIQKYAMLANKFAPGGSNYDDWSLHGFGAYSENLESDLHDLRQGGLITVMYKGRNPTAWPKYSITNQSITITSDFKDKNPETVKKMSEITSYYNDKQLDELLADSYMLFPKYSCEAHLKQMARKNILERNADDEIFHIPYANKKIHLKELLDRSEKNHLTYDDITFTDELAEKMGLPRDQYADKDPGDLEDIFAKKEFVKKLTEKDVREIIDSIR